MTGINGLKISGALCLVRLYEDSRGSGLLPAFCRLLAGSRINMLFLSTESDAGGTCTTCCVDAAHAALLKNVLATEPVLQERAEFTAGVGLLTLFPHRSRLTLFGRSLRALTQAGLRVFAVASSVGTLTYVLEHAQLDKAAAVMQACFEFVGNHAPFKADLRLRREPCGGPEAGRERKETRAVYGEPQIKTYGFQVVKNLALYSYRLPADLPAEWTRAIKRIEDEATRFHLLQAQLRESFELDLQLLCEPEQGAPLARRIAAEIPAAGDRLLVTAPVELIFFQGPHFGDRFGIADFTYKALEEKTDVLLAAVFACASIYLMLPEGAADEARTRLAAAFRIPG